MQTTEKSKNANPLRVAVRAALIAAALAPVMHFASAGNGMTNPVTPATFNSTAINRPATFVQQGDRPRIQIAILLDTSNSMDGLIDQTRNQLWQVVNEFSSARQDGKQPVLEIALFEYGNDSNPQGKGYVRKLNSFTRELDAISAGLFSLTTNGGNEYSGFAIKTALTELQWSRSESDIKTIFIAGNESFAQGPVRYQDAIELAGRFGVAVNTIYAGTHEAGISEGWQDGAQLAGGDYLSIDANRQVVHIVAPQDEKIAELNAQLNQTYIPYGSDGADKHQRQLEQDALSSEISAGLLAKRAQSKISAFYRNSNWDLVDALRDGLFDEDALEEIETENLPEPMQALAPRERVEYVQQQAESRKLIQQQINELGEQRAAFVAEKKRELAAAAPSVGDALGNAVKKQARDKNFVFEN